MPNGLSTLSSQDGSVAYPELVDLQAIIVSILHGSGPGESPKNWHTEDVIKFRKGPSQRSAIHMILLPASGIEDT